MRVVHRVGNSGRVVSVNALLGVMLALAGCGAAQTSSSTATQKVSVAIPKSGCGSVALPAPKDPDGVLAALPGRYDKDYAGYPPPVYKTPWADFKPNHPPPYKVALSFAQLTVSTQVALFNTLKRDFGNDPDYKFTGVSTGGQLNIPQQLQQVSTLLNDKPDILIVEPLTDAFGPLVDKAAKEGIPTVSIQGTTDSKYAVNVQSNDYGTGAYVASNAIRQAGGKGNLLYVHSIASTTIDADTYDATKAVMKNCPGMKLAGEIAGAFVPSTAKAETLKFLATHPEPINVVMQTAGMAPGIISAFKEAGRPIPVVADIGGLDGSLSYWINNKDSYSGIGGGFPPKQAATGITNLVKRMLAGRGLQVSNVTFLLPPITSANLADWADAKKDLNALSVSEGPPGAIMSDEFLSGLFENPAPVK